MKKLIIQVPCFNEEETLAITLADLPRQVEGFEKVEWLVIDDGSSDKTQEVARANGVDHIVAHVGNRGLAKAFMTGLHSCLERGADVIVNTDADNQYSAKSIPDLVAPIVEGRAEIVVGARPIMQTKHFSLVKKVLQRLGSFVVRTMSHAEVDDAPSGFRAYSRKAAQQMNVFSRYTYTLETIIQAGQKGIALVSVPVSTNRDLRPSRLVKSIPSYVKKSVVTIFRISMTYRPLRFFCWLSIPFLIAGLAINFRFLYLYMMGGGEGHVQSLILGAVLIIIGFGLVVLGLIGDLISVNRLLLEKIDGQIQSLVDQRKEDL